MNGLHSRWIVLSLAMFCAATCLVAARSIDSASVVHASAEDHLLAALEDTSPIARAAFKSSRQDAVLKGKIVDGSGTGRSITFHLRQIVEPLQQQGSTAGAISDPLFGRTVVTSEDGSFEVHGLPKGWRGWIVAPSFGEFTSASWTGMSVKFPTPILPLSLPTADIRMTFRTFPMIRGRVASASGIGDERFGFELRAGTATGGTLSINNGGFGGDTGFQWSLGPIPLVSVSIIIWSRETRGRAKYFHFEGPIERDLDLGDVVLLPARKVSVSVVDSSGKAIPEAVITHSGTVVMSFDDQPHKERRHTDPKSFEIRGGQCTITIQAEGYQRRTLVVPESAPDTIVVPLQRCTLLTARVTTSDGSAPSCIKVRVRAVDGKNALSAAIDQVPISDEYVTCVEEGFLTKFSDKGIIRFCGLPAQRPLSLEVYESDGVRLSTMPVTLNEGEWRDVVCRIDAAERRITGVVRDRQGAPIDEAEVEFNGMTARNGRHGRFEIAGVFVRVGTLKVVRPGYLTLVREGFTFPVDGPDVEIVLDRGKPLMVHVVDTDGKSFVLGRNVDWEPPVVWVEVPSRNGEIFRPRSRYYYRKPPSDLPALPPPGSYIFDGLPEGPIVIKWFDAARHVHERSHDTRDPEVSVQVPLHGALRVAIGVALSDAHEYRVKVRMQGAAEACVQVSNIVEGFLSSSSRIWDDQDCDAAQLIPGAYEVLLERRDRFETDAGAIERWTPISKPAEVRVNAGARAHLLLERLD